MSCAHHRPENLSWARLRKRVFEIDMEDCPNCGGELKIIAAILEQPVIEKILTRLGLQAPAPPWAPAPDQALHAASRCPTLKVHATRHPAPVNSAASEGSRDRWQQAGGQGQLAGGAHEERFSAALSTPTRSRPPSKTDTHALRTVFGAPWRRKKGVGKSHPPARGFRRGAQDFSQAQWRHRRSASPACGRWQHRCQAIQ